jgi:predicted amidohydrolase YtcJ
MMNLQGATVLPGLIDAHTHLINLGESLVRLNLKDIPTEEEIVERVKQRAPSLRPVNGSSAGAGTKAGGPRTILRTRL